MMDRACCATGVIFRRGWRRLISCQLSAKNFNHRGHWETQRDGENFMKLSIDNLAGAGAVDYTSSIDLTVAPRLLRKINQPAELRCSLAGAGQAIVAGARVILTKANGNAMFTGYLTQTPQCEYLGWGRAGAAYRYHL